MGQHGLDQIYTKQEQQAIKDEGYRAQVEGKNLVEDNPYNSHNPKYWLWRQGYIEAYNDSKR